MKEQKRLDKVLEVAYTSAQEEVSALIGATIKLSEPSFALKSKEDAFDDISFKQVLSKIDVRGDIEGDGCLCFNLKDAIRLGGILIMLPAAELDEVVADENYSDETEDSFGEIANIIAGAYSKSFEEMYPKSCRLIRKEQELVVPAKIDIESDEPVADQMYYVATHSMTIDDAEMGNMVLMLPAITFGLVEEPVEAGVSDSVEQEEPSQAVEESQAESDAPEPAESETTPEPTVDEVTASAAADPSEDSNELVVPYNEKNLPKIDKIIEAATITVTEEVGGLIGAEITLTDSNSTFLNKEDLFDDLLGKQIIAKMDVRGDIEGEGALFVSVKGAIRLGGTLIMLPQTELEEIVGREEYNEETEDSYGEIANIIAGSYSKVFEEMYSKNCRLIRKEQSIISPVKVDVDSNEPVANEMFYVVKSSLGVSGMDSGHVVMALPAKTFGLIEPVAVKEPVSNAQPETAATPSGGDNSSAAETAGSTVTQEPAKEVKPPFDSDKQKEKVDKVLQSCTNTMQEEMSAMLGSSIVLKGLENKLVSKEDFFFDEASGKQIVAFNDVVGDEEDKSFFYVGLKDAVRIGGILIMLPPSELETSVTEEEYTEDIEDAYGEIANIISGVYTSVFEEQYSKNLRFIRKELDTVVPMKVDIDADTPMPDQKYYLHAISLTIGEKELGNMHMLFPAELLQLERLGEVIEEPVAPEPAKEESAGTIDSSAAGNADSASVTGGGDAAGGYDIIVIGNDEFEKGKLRTVLEAKGLKIQDLTFKDNVYNYINPDVKAVFLVMQEVNELAFGVAIKISTACKSPLIAAGSAWTRTSVIKAVKYGVSDILLTPATDADIEEKIESNLVQLAA